MENKIKELEKKVAELEKKVQEQPTLEEIISEISNGLVKSLKKIKNVQNEMENWKVEDTEKKALEVQAQEQSNNFMPMDCDGIRK